MARAVRRPQSRRRTAALKFLSNISLENNVSNSDEIDEQFVRVEREPFHCLMKKDVNKDGNSTFQEYVSLKYVETEFAKPSLFTPFRERSNTANCEMVRQMDLKQKKIISVEEILPPVSYSSTESITSGCGKQKLDFSFRMKKLREVKVTSASNLRNCKNDRIMLVSPATKTPFYVFSFLPYRKMKSKGDKKESGSRRRNLSGSRPLSTFIDTLDPYLLLGLEKFENGQMISYQQFLLPTVHHSAEIKEITYPEIQEKLTESASKSVHISRCMSVDLSVSSKFPVVPSSPPCTELRGNDWEEFGFGNSSAVSYSPFLLDDPELMSGKHRTVLTFPSYRASIIDYVRPSELKKELNEKFREKFPQIQLTLSKLRSLKKEMKGISKTEKCVDLLTVAQSYVYYEKLILRNVINKTNRKICAAVCLLLSAKMNDIKGAAMKQLFEKLESVFRLSRKDVLALEFPVVVALEFSLHVPTWEVLPHFQRLTYES